MSEPTRHRRAGGGILDSTLSKVLKRAVVVQTILILAVIWSYAGWSIRTDREQTLETGRQQLRTISAGLQSHVDAILNDAVGSAVASSNAIRHQGGIDSMSDEELAQTLARHLTGGEYVRALLVATPHRFAQVARDRSSVTGPMPPDWLQAVMRTPQSATYIGHPIELKPTGEQVVPVLSRVSSGSEEMWTGALLDLASLNSLYRGLRFDDGILGVVASGGNVLIRVPTPSLDLLDPEVNARRTAVLQRQTEVVDEALFEMPGPVSGQPTIFYTRRIAGYSLFVAASRARASVLAPWRARTVNVLAVLSGISIVLVGLAFLLRNVASKLERRDSHYRSLFNNSAVSVILMSREAFLEGNATTYRMFRLPADAPLEGLRPWDLSPELQPDGRKSSVAAQEYIRRAQSLGQLQFRWLHKRMDSNEPFPADVNLSSIQVGDQSLILAIVNDVTELEAARLQLQSLNSELEHRVRERTAELQDANARLALTNQELEAFTASASHDLRSPLGSIAGQTGLLREDLQPLINDAVRYRLDRIADSVKRCAEIIDGLLSLAKVSRQGLIKEPIDVTALTRNIVADLRLQYPGHAVDCQVPEGLALDADPRLIKSLLANLLDNAWKYTAKSPAPTVELRYMARDGMHEFLVGDNGAGFNMAYASRIFEPFQRMHSAAEFPGIGVGLATVARIVQRYGGRIWVESAPGRGTTFHFTLPAAMPRQTHVTEEVTVADPG